MKYVALVYYNEAELGQLTQAQWDALNRECLACGEHLQGQGQMIGGQALRSVQSATTLRIRDGQLAMTDGPFAETKEQLAGFYLLDVRDLNEAIQTASKIPPGRYGSIEIRPVRELATENNLSYASTSPTEPTQ